MPEIGSQVAGFGGHDTLGNLGPKHSAILELGTRLEIVMAVAVAEPLVGRERPVTPLGGIAASLDMGSRRSRNARSIRVASAAVKASGVSKRRQSAVGIVPVGRVVPSRNPSNVSRSPVPVHGSRGVPVPWIPDPADAAGVAPVPVVIGGPSPGLRRYPSQTGRCVDPPA